MATNNTCPRCNSTRTPPNVTACVDCGYQSLAMLGVIFRAGPRSRKIADLIALIRQGYPWRDAAAIVGITRASAEVAFLRYVVYPEWLEAKRDEEEYVRHEPYHSELELPPCPRRRRSASTPNS